MDSREAIMEAAISLIEEKGERLEDITVREICKRANVGLGLVNYHFGNKDRLIELCIERIINGIVEQFRAMGDTAAGTTPFEKLEYLGELTLTFLFEHDAVSKISMLTDMRAPAEDDNTSRTYRAYLPLVAACRPDWDQSTVERKTFCLIAVMQQSFLRRQMILRTQGVDLTKADQRRAFHTQMLRDLLEVQP